MEQKFQASVKATLANVQYIHQKMSVLNYNDVVYEYNKNTYDVRLSGKYKTKYHMK